MEEIQEMSFAYIELSVENPKRAANVLSEKLGLTNFKLAAKGQIRIYDSRVSVQELSKKLALEDVAGKRSETLEDYFLKMTEEVSPYVSAD